MVAKTKALLCPITSRVKGYPFEVLMPKTSGISGVVLADQIKSLDWKARQAQYICAAPSEVVAEVIAKIEALLT